MSVVLSWMVRHSFHAPLGEFGGAPAVKSFMRILDLAAAPESDAEDAARGGSRLPVFWALDGQIVDESLSTVGANVGDAVPAGEGLGRRYTAGCFG